MSKKNILIIKLIMGVLAAITLGAVIYYLIEMFVIEKPSYFTAHFMAFICLFCIGGIALLLPSINRKKFSGETKGDSLMVIVGFLLILCSFLSIMISYMA